MQGLTFTTISLCNIVNPFLPKTHVTIADTQTQHECGYWYAYVLITNKLPVDIATTVSYYKDFSFRFPQFIVYLEPHILSSRYLLSLA